MSKIKRILSEFLFLVFLIMGVMCPKVIPTRKTDTLLPDYFIINANATDDEGTYGPLSYYELDDEILLSKCDKNATGDILIPSKINNKNVTTVLSYAFFGCKRIKSVAIPDTVTAIGNNAFEHCESLTSITLSKSLTSIPYSAFSSCYSLKTATIPSNVESLGMGAFESCSSLATIILPDGLKEIGSHCFEFSGLTNITIPKGVVGIHERTFRQCDSLSSVIFNEGLKYIEWDAFQNYGDYGGYGDYGIKSLSLPSSFISFAYGKSFLDGPGGVLDCQSLERINISSNSTKYSSVDGVLFNKNQTILYDYPSGRKDSAYVIPHSVKVIGSGAFGGADALTSVTIPDTVTMISAWSFSGTSLTEVTLPEHIKGIGEQAFEGTFITSLHIGKHVYASDAMCQGMHCLKTISVDKDNQHYTVDNGVLFSKDKTYLIHYPNQKKGNSFIVPDSVNTIGLRCKTHTLPNTEGVTVDEYSLKEIIIPASVKNIDLLQVLGDKHIVSLKKVNYLGTSIFLKKKAIIENEYYWNTLDVVCKDEFTVGRDNNNYVHSFEKPEYGFYNSDNYKISSKSVREKLFSYANNTERKKLLEKERSEWTGFCYGIALTMGLAYRGNLPVVNDSYDYYYHSMPLPWKETDFLNIIKYYTLTYSLSAYQAYSYTYYNPEKVNNGSDFNSLSELFDYMFSSIDSSGIAVFVFSKPYKVGHTIIAKGYSKQSDGSFKVDLYDENGRKELCMTVSKNKSSFNIPYEDPVTDKNYKYLGVINCDEYIKAEKSKSRLNRLEKSVNSKDSLYTISFLETDNFVLTDNMGHFISQNNGVLNSDMDIIDINPVVSNNSTEYYAVIKGETNINYSAQSPVNLSVYNDESYFRLASDNVESIDINLGKEITINGDNSSIETAFCFNSSDDVSVYSLSGKQSKTTRIILSNNDIDISTSGLISNLLLNKVEYEGDKEIYGTTASNISVKKNGTVYDGDKLVYSPSKISIRNYRKDIAVDYLSQLTVHAVTENAPAGSSIHWYGRSENTEGIGEELFTDSDTVTINANGNGYFYVQLVDKDGSVLATSEVENIHIKSKRFFAMLLGLIRAWLGLQPIIEQ